MKPASALFLMILLSSTPALSQRMKEGITTEHRSLLMLEKKNKNKNAYYEKGDEISFQIKGRKSKLKAEIIDFNPDFAVGINTT
jgi:hypothetical protein